jgi:hypothetical protein
MAWIFTPGNYTGGATPGPFVNGVYLVNAFDYQAIAHDIQHWGGNMDAAGFALTNASYSAFQAGTLPGSPAIGTIAVDNSVSPNVPRVFLNGGWSPFGIQVPFYVSLASGSSTVYAGNLAPTITAYTPGYTYCAKIDVTNTAASTINFNSVGAATIKRWLGGALVNVFSGDLQATQIAVFKYDGTNMVLINPSGYGVTSALTWTALSLSNSWTNGAGYRAASYALSPFNILRLSGGIQGGTLTDGTTVFTMPVGFRPPNAVQFPIAYGASPYTLGTLSIATTGVATVNGISGGGASHIFGLEGIGYALN